MRSRFVYTVSEALIYNFNAWSQVLRFEIFSLVSCIHDENLSL